MTIWTPRVTVAAVIEKDNRFLFVKEIANENYVYNQPAGHLEDNESLLNAVEREVYEETGLKFNPEKLLAIYRFKQIKKSRTYIRFVFTGEVEDAPLSPKDENIIDAIWIGLEEIKNYSTHFRSPQVLAAIEDYCSGVRYNLEMLKDFAAI